MTPQDALEQVREALHFRPLEYQQMGQAGHAALTEIESYVRELERERENLEDALREEIKRATENGRLAQQHWDRAERAEAEVRRLKGRIAELEGADS